jgi:hypothetical protein
MLGVQGNTPLAPVESVGGDLHVRQQTFSPLVADKSHVLPMIHTPMTTTILFFQ